MKYAIIADIHANLEAFQVVLEDIKQQKCTHYACLGDVVGYNANPKECLDLVRDMDIPVVKGNHDDYCSTDQALDGFNPAAAASFTYQNTSVCFFGHTHVPVAFIRDSMVRGGTYSKFKVEPGKKYFVNVGAIGQPRDNNPKAAYVVYDMDESTIELRRLEYDIASAQKKILDAGLPPRLAERLAFGR